MGPTWVLSAPDGPLVGPLNLAIRVVYVTSCRWPPQVGESHVDLVNCSEITTCESTGVIKKTPFNCSAMDNAICNEDDGIACECAPGYKPFRVKPKILLPCISKGYTMMTSSKNIFRVAGLLFVEFTGHPHKGQWRRALMFSLICTWTNGWVSNRDAADLRRHRAHYDVTVMSRPFSICGWSRSEPMRE